MSIYSAAAGSFLLLGFADSRRLERIALFLRFKYAVRRLRFDRIRCCWPTLLLYEGRVSRASDVAWQYKKSRIAFCPVLQLNNSLCCRCPRTSPRLQKP